MRFEAEAASEHQPLLPRPESQPLLQHTQQRFCLRVLFWPSGRLLWFALFALFLVHLLATDTFAPWWSSAVVSIKADVLFMMCLVVTVVVLLFVLLTAQQLTSLVTCLPWTILVTTILWYVMLKICTLHSLRVRCWIHQVCISKEVEGAAVEPDLEGLAHFLLSWAWLPSGLFSSVGGACWRPWWLIFSALPQALAGQPAMQLPWWQWREILVGSCFMPSFMLLAATGLGLGAEWWWVAICTVTLSLVLTAVPFYLTTEPMAQYWSFLGRIWEKLLLREGSLALEEWLALIMMVWNITRMLYIAASVRLEEWSARKRVEEGLQYALEHPFRAELEHGFGSSARSSGAGLLRTLSHHFVPDPALPEASGTTLPNLAEKRKALHDACLALRGDATILPSRLQLYISREHLLEDTWAALLQKPTSELLAPGMSVHFLGELGADAGGLTRDWFDSVARALAVGTDEVSGSSLLTTAPDQTLIPRPVGLDHGEVLEEDHEKYKSLMALGRFLALAVYRERPLPLSFSLVACKHLLSVPVGMADVERLDPEFYRGRVEAVLKENGLADLEAVLGEPLVFMSAPTELRPQPDELKPGGATIAVTDATKAEYVQLLCEAYLCNGMRREIRCILQGFWDLLPLKLLRHCRLTPRELSLLISGTRSLDPVEWERCNQGGGTQIDAWFWEVVRELDDEQRCMLLHFATGSSRLPPGGFKDLQPTFAVSIASGGEERLPVAHTCSNQIVLQEYASKQQLHEKLLMALSAEGFDFV